MTSNFTVHHHTENGNLRVDLNGDFDGTSACELLNLIEGYRNKVKKVIINTDGLKSIHPFGKAVFEKQVSALNFRFDSIIFLGGKRIQFI
jgi:hypothetical protein